MRKSRVIFSRTVGLMLATSVLVACNYESKISSALLASQPDIPIESVQKSPMKGIYQVNLQGGNQIYTDATGEFILEGNLYQIKDSKVIDHSSIAKSGFIKSEIDKLSEKDMVVFDVEHRKATITIFTDPQCPYCRKLHDEMIDLNEAGIAVRYLAFPPQGPGSEAFDVATSIWCSEDRLGAMSQAKKGEAVTSTACENPVLAQYELGKLLGVRGTPTILLESGEMLSGYIPHEQLIQLVLEKTDK